MKNEDILTRTAITITPVKDEVLIKLKDSFVVGNDEFYLEIYDNIPDNILHSLRQEKNKVCFDSWH